MPIKSWGILVAIGFMAGLFLAKKRAEKKGISSEELYDIALILLISGLIFGRFVFILFDLKYYISNPVQLIMIQNGGMSIHGSLIGGFAATYIYCRRKGISILKLGDVVAPSILLGQAIGRIGCFLNGDDYGFITKSFLGVRFPNIGGPPRHPTQLYETFFDLIAFGLIIFLGKKVKKDGQLFFIASIFYFVIRIFVEVFRDDMVILFWKVTWGEAASAIAVIASIIALFFIYKNESPNPKLRTKSVS